MASKSAQNEVDKSEVIEELLDLLDTTLDRVKVLYEQFFLGIQKQPPAHLHTDVERKLRDLQQMQIRNTALRYRVATIQQKFGSYNTYWRRTLRQIENGTYHRNLAKIGRQAVLTGEEIPEEILAAMPKRMREQVKRDREAALARANRRDRTEQGDAIPEEQEDQGTNPIAATVTRSGAHVLDESDASFDLDAYFQSITSEDAPAAPPAPAAPRARAFDDEQRAEAEPSAPRAVPPAPPPAPMPRPAVRAAVGLRTPPTGAPRVAHAIAATPTTRSTQPIPTIATPSGRLPAIPPPQSGQLPAIPAPGPRPAPSQVVHPLPVTPGASRDRTPVPVESLRGPFPRERTADPTTASIPAHPDARATAPPPANVRATQGIGEVRAAAPPRPNTPPPARPPVKPVRATTEPGVVAPARPGPPPGMTDADVNALYAKYVKAKEAVGEKAGPGAYGKLLQTINAQAPKIMEQYKAKSVDFQVVVKDNQVVIRAKPKT